MSLRPLDAEMLAWLMIKPPEGCQVFRFSAPSPFEDYWDLIAIHPQPLDPSLLEIRLLHIDDLMLEAADDPQDPPGDRATTTNLLYEAQGFVEVTRITLETLIKLFTVWADGPEPAPASVSKYFHRMNPRELADVHAAHPITHFTGGYYRYHPDDEVAAKSEISMVLLPDWGPPNRPSDVSILEFATFDQQRLEDSTFDPLYSWGLGRITFNRPALRAFITLLEGSRPPKRNSQTTP